MLSRWLERWWKLLLVLGIMAWSLYEIYPTMVWYSLPEIDRRGIVRRKAAASSVKYIDRKSVV